MSTIATMSTMPGGIAPVTVNMSTMPGGIGPVVT